MGQHRFKELNRTQCIYAHIKSDVDSKLHGMTSIISEATFIRLFTKAFLLGAYLVSFFVCLRWLVFSDDGCSLRKDTNRPMLIVTIIFFALSLVDFGLGTYSKLSRGADTWVYDITVSNLNCHPNHHHAD